MQVLEKCTKLINYSVDDSIGEYIKIVIDLAETLKNLPKLKEIKELILEKIKILEINFDSIVMQVKNSLRNIELTAQLERQLSELESKISRFNQEGVPVPPELQNNQRETLEKLYQHKIQSKEKLIEATNKLIDTRRESLNKVERRIEVYPDAKKKKQLKRKRRKLELTIAINQLELKKKTLEDEQKSLLKNLATVSTRGVHRKKIIFHHQAPHWEDVLALH